MFTHAIDPTPTTRPVVFLITQRAICLFPQSPWPDFLGEHLKVAEAAYVDTLLAVLAPSLSNAIERETVRDEARHSYSRLLFAFCRHHAINLYATSPVGGEAFRTAMDELSNLLYQLTEKNRMLIATYGADIAVNPLWGASLREAQSEIDHLYNSLLEPDFFDESADALFTFAKARLEKRPTEALRALYRRAQAENFREQEIIELLEGVKDPEERCAIERALSRSLLIRDLITILTPEERATRSFDVPAVLERIKAVHRALRDPQSRARNLALAHAHGLNIRSVPHYLHDWIDILRNDPTHRPEASFLRALWENETPPTSTNPQLDFIRFLLDSGRIGSENHAWVIEDNTLIETDTPPHTEDGIPHAYPLPQTFDELNEMKHSLLHAADAEAYLPQAIEFLQGYDTIALSTLQRHLTHSYNLTLALIDRLIQSGHLTPTPAGGYKVEINQVG